MVIKINTDTKTIEIEGVVNAKELFDEIQKLGKMEDWEIVQPISYTPIPYTPIWPQPIIPYYYNFPVTGCGTQI